MVQSSTNSGSVSGGGAAVALLFETVDAVENVVPAPEQVVIVDRTLVHEDDTVVPDTVWYTQLCDTLAYKETEHDELLDDEEVREVELVSDDVVDF